MNLDVDEIIIIERFRSQLIFRIYKFRKNKRIWWTNWCRLGIDTKHILFKEPEIYIANKPEDDDNTSHLRNKRLRIERKFQEIQAINISELVRERNINIHPTDIRNKPLFCKNDYNCQNCQARVSFTISQINNSHEVNSRNIQIELGAHGHKQSLKIKKNRWRIIRTL